MANLTVNTKKYGQITLNPIQTLTNELLNCKILIINSFNSKTKRPTDGEHSFKGNDRKSVVDIMPVKTSAPLEITYHACLLGSLPFRKQKKKSCFALRTATL